MTKPLFTVFFAATCVFMFLVSCSPTESSLSDNGDGYRGDNSSAFATFDAVDAIDIVESPETGVALGWGWNRGDSEPIPTICVEFVPGEEPAQTRYMTMSEVHDSYDLMKSVGMSAEASVKTIGFEAEGKASFAKSQKLTGDKSHFVLNAIVQNGVRYASPIPPDKSRVSKYQSATNERGGSSGSIRLTDEAVKWAGNIDEFRRHCGSSFVSAIYGGAKLTALISMEASSKEDKERLSAEMSGSGWGVKVKAKVDAAANKTEGHEKMDVSIFMTGGKGDAIPIDVKDLKAKMETISMDAYVAPKDFQIAITPYELLSNWPGKPLPDKETEFEELASYWGAYNTLYDDLQRVLDDPRKYFDLEVDKEGDYALRYCLEESEAYMQALAAMETSLIEIDAKNRKDKALSNTPLGGFAAFVAQQVSTEKESEAYKAVQEVISKTTASSTALDACVKKQAGLKDSTEVDIEKLKRAQDEVLAALKHLEGEARECSDKTDTCDFNPDNYRSPYAFRAQMPLPTDAGVTSFKELVDYKMGLLAKRRCQVSANDTDCLSNADLDNWTQKIGLIPVNKNVQPELFAKYLPAVASGKKKIPSGVAVMEPGRDDVLWVNPVDLRN